MKADLAASTKYDLLGDLDPRPGTGDHIPHCIVGVGASAGGLEALTAMMKHARPDEDLAYIVVQHLDPDQSSSLADLLGDITTLEVQQVTGDEYVTSGRVYIIPPGKNMAIKNDQLILTDFDQPRGIRRPIDLFFASLAACRGPMAAGVVLSGTGMDGSTGLRAIKEEGGLCIAQDPGSAAYAAMPLAAQATGMVDLSLKPTEIVAAIREYHAARPAKDGVSQDVILDFIDPICRLLHHQIGHDFSGYRRTTLTRRIHHRMQLRGIIDPAQYYDLLQHEPAECDALFHDFLINVTQFFRDPAYYEVLRDKVVAPLVRDCHSGILRVWVPGCSSGEEAFSIAMLFDQAIQASGKPISLRIFATDIDDKMLRLARMGHYPVTAEFDIPDDLRQRYVQESELGIQISTHLRDAIRFSVHNVLTDPPFGAMDLIICRNLLIYLATQSQKTVQEVFHFATRPGGYLFLGPAEAMGHQDPFFTPIDATARIYRRNDAPAQIPKDLAAISGPTLPQIIRPDIETPIDPDDIVHLRRDLRHTREQLRINIEELETANEELKTANEEMLSMNEMLQSANAELSIVNNRLNAKVGQLVQANSDLQNFFDNSPVPLIVLDQQMRLRKVTETVGDLYTFSPHDLGRPLADLGSQLANPAAALDLVKEVIATGQKRKTRLTGKHHRRVWSLTVSPYLTESGARDGAIMVFSEMSDVFHLQRALLEEGQRLRLALDAARLIVWSYDPRNGLFSVRDNRNILGLRDHNDLTLDHLTARIAPDDQADFAKDLNEAARTNQGFDRNFAIFDDEGRMIWVHATAVHLDDATGAPMIGVFSDISAARRTSDMKEALLREMDHRIKNLFALVSGMLRLVGRGATSVEEVVTGVETRISALARSHDLTFLGRAGTSITLVKAVEAALAPYANGENMQLSGPAITVSSEQLTPLSLLLHEWATNASKYGVLGPIPGKLEIEWALKKGRVCLNWLERYDNPVHVVDSEPGFGSALIETTAMQLDAELEIEIKPTHRQMQLHYDQSTE